MIEGPTSDAGFQELINRTLASYYEAHPDAARALGLHEYDGQVPDLSADGVTRRMSTLDQQIAALDGLDVAQLSTDQVFDRDLLASSLRYERFDLAELCTLERDPIAWAEQIDVSGYVKRSYAPVNERADRLREHLAAIPTVLTSARKRLASQISRPVLEIALDVFAGTASFLRDDVPAALSAQGASANVQPELDQAVVAVQSFHDFLRDGLGRAIDDFALGAERFSVMLRLGELVDVPLDELEAAGRADLERNLALARQTARESDPGRTTEEVFARLAIDHPTASDLVRSTRELLLQLEEFVRREAIVSIPTDQRCLVEETPSFLRWAFAMMDTAGPYEPADSESFYYVTPPEPDWDIQRQDEWLQNFSSASLPVVSIHEAYPGHYVHFLHLRRIESPVRRAMLSYSFVEGWAHYTEEMMLEAGFGEGDPRIRLAQLREALVRNCRYVAAIAMHTQGMTVDEATTLFRENAFSSEAAARQEAMRGTFDAGYLNYTLGKLMLRKLRSDYQRERGQRFNRREFHDRLLELGAPPFPLARRALLRQDDGVLL